MSTATAMQHQNRVKATLKSTILDFFKSRTNVPQFTGEDFLAYVHSHHVCASNSPLRIMQVLKKEGVINYNVVEADYLDRQKTVYEVRPTAAEAI